MNNIEKAKKKFRAALMLTLPKDEAKQAIKDFESIIKQTEERVIKQAIEEVHNTESILNSKGDLLIRLEQMLELNN